MKNITKNLALIIALLFTFLIKANGQERKLINFVNPFIGTAPLTDPKILGYELPEGWRSWAGLCFPGASLPNAMVQLSPMTEYGSGAGYEYEDDTILGFAHTNKGHWNLCNIPILPMSNPSGSFGSKFSHSNEKASPGYYQVYLSDYAINVKLTTTLRGGFHQYSFTNSKNRQILFDLGKANSHVSNWRIQQDGKFALKGFQGGENIFFYAILNTAIDHLKVKEEGSKKGYAVAHLADSNSDPVELKIGLSFVSVENAKKNLEKEIGSKTFDQIKSEAELKWEKLLSTIRVEGGNKKQQTMFYSSLYRSFLWPALRSDVSGEFSDAKGSVTKSDFRYYTEPSLWDTYRNKDVLLGLISPDVTLDVIKSMIDVGEKKGFMPTFFHGDHGTSSVAGAYLRGIKDFDIGKAYRIFLKNANLDPGARPFIKEYIEKGYISDPDIQYPHVETKAKAGVSKTLEYAYDDYSLAQIAQKLGDSLNYRKLLKRSQNYKNMFDPSSRFMRGRLDNGEWIKPFDPQYPYYEYMYREANAWQVSFYAPHDMPGLINLYGGAEGFESKLDSLFTVPWNPKYIARNVETMIGQYCHGNQPDHEAPFGYTFIGKPEKSQKIIDKILNELYGIGDQGLALAGMDDAGEMSSWYVFCALGLYPFSATDPSYIVTAPLFDKVEWKTSGGRQLTITKPNKGRMITQIKVNGKAIKGFFIDHDLFLSGGKIEIITQ